MDPDSLLPRSRRLNFRSIFQSFLSYSYNLFAIICMLAFLLLFSPLPRAGASPLFFQPDKLITSDQFSPQVSVSQPQKNQTNHYNQTLLARPLPITTVLISLLFIVMVIWLFYRARSEERNKPQM